MRAEVKVDGSSSHCANVSRKGRELPDLPIAQPDGPVFGHRSAVGTVKSKAKGIGS